MAERKFLTDRPLQALRPAKSGTRYELYDSREPTLGVHVIAYYERKHAALPPGVYRCGVFCDWHRLQVIQLRRPVRYNMARAAA